MVIVELTGAPAGSTVDRENEHKSPAGRPEQVKLTDWVNPFAGVMVRVIVADWSALIVALAGEDASVKEGGEILITYAAVATALFA
jgi:hypothetical protein